MDTDNKRLIKKYPNRRLYDTYLRTYITLHDIRKLVCDKVNFKVIDARSQKDLTQNTLLQIIADQELHEIPIFSNVQLENFIRLYHDQSQALFGKFLESAIDSFIQQKNSLMADQQNTGAELIDITLKKAFKTAKI